MSRILIWYRNDLRLHDHQPLHAALTAQADVIPLYCWDSRLFGTTSFGFPKTGAWRAFFLWESVADLRAQLRSRGSDLLLRRGLPETVIPPIALELKISAVYFHKEVTSEEIAVEEALQHHLARVGIKVKSFWGTTLYNPEELPFTIGQLPEIFTQFRKQVEKKSTVSPSLPTPTNLPPLPAGIELGEMPDKFEPPVLDKRAVMQFTGGERAGRERLEEYFWKQDCLKAYKQTRNGMLGANYSSKFSPWLANGCLSPRFIYEQVKEYESQRMKNDSTYWLVFELMWRDYFRFICAKHGKKIFRKSGLQGINIPWQEDHSQFALWQQGMTGFPLVDANMRELAATGFMSNRGRQNAASFLTKNLGINWQMGAEWFESQLIDYDVCSNWGNWNYTAGVGNDARGFRYFNIQKQSQNYDLQGEYVKHWLPELQNIPANKVHEPWKLSAAEQRRYNVRLGVDYPQQMVDLWQSVQAAEKIYNAALGLK